MTRQVFPTALNDGDWDYVLVRQTKDLGNGITEIPLYERVPSTGSQYTPHLEYVTGLTEMPVMLTVGKD